MRPPVSAALSRVLSLTILAALLALVFGVVVEPLLDKYNEARASSERYRVAVARASQSSRNLVALEAELAHLKQHRATAVGFLKGANESLAAADLQNRIRSAVDKVRGELRSTQTLPSRDDGQFRQITVRGQMAVTLSGLQRIFYDLESTTPFLFLDNVEIRARAPRQSREQGNEDTLLEVRFDLAGYMRRTT